MNEQTILLLFLIFGLGITLLLYVWKAKKEIEYRKDERWQLIQNKANNTANYSNYILILFLAAGEAVTLFKDIQITFTFDKALTYGLLFVGLRNSIEFFSLKYYDKQL
ncbi:hypothetical protein [Vallitalea guaymasensis]|uniref:Uncharacterized protein n=1 Tax=Vallitalea guaymasensis TaxID=1185412 RepID=A0A8J8SBA3_9FIRM|nr:hypothetical protein [Vallitalea guaymasensis]QUH28136.1 hypothetical protein HYG85_04095 [Vallitalea guaymasensis]